jgi:hypothetical protein
LVRSVGLRVAIVASRRFFPCVVEVMVQRASAILALVVLGGVAMAEVNVISPFAAVSPDEPGWRRTAQGWIKVGPLGDAAFLQPTREPVTRAVIHPLVFSAFVALASLAALMLEDGVANAASPPSSDAAERGCHRPHFGRAMARR